MLLAAQRAQPAEPSASSPPSARDECDDQRHAPAAEQKEQPCVHKADSAVTGSAAETAGNLPGLEQLPASAGTVQASVAQSDHASDRTSGRTALHAAPLVCGATEQDTRAHELLSKPERRPAEAAKTLSSTPRKVQPKGSGLLPGTPTNEDVASAAESLRELISSLLTNSSIQKQDDCAVAGQVCKEG
jgi:hypothetical protein